jgi:uncharacterized SAM-binding protein YcdF (DUF218 family)
MTVREQTSRDHARDHAWALARARLPRIRLRAGWLILVLMSVALGLAWLARHPLLRSAAALWVVSDPLDSADAIVVLGGGLDVRPFAAADLYKRGLAHRILIANSRQSPAEKLEVVPAHVELNRKVLLKQGVPAEAIVTFGDGLSNTYEEARALLAWATANGIRSVIIPTEPFPARRVMWIFDHELGPAGIRVIVEPRNPPQYDLDDWWRNEHALIDFEVELIKYLYYRVRYF